MQLSTTRGMAWPESFVGQRGEAQQLLVCGDTDRDCTREQDPETAECEPAEVRGREPRG